MGSLPPRIEQVNDNSPSCLEMLRFARRIAEQQLTQVDRWIAAEERREAERQHGIAARPPAPDWLIEHGLSGQDSMYVHTGDCWNAGKRSKGVTRDTALRALTEGGAPACPRCRPDTALGILEGLFRRCSAAVRSPTSTASAHVRGWWKSSASEASTWGDGVHQVMLGIARLHNLALTG
ncbi:hypothetical protein OK006_11116 [Actinobacteria bacterium OK006]|nr:hypothetical protein OK006_11116 [Actinobacteria bacterium OK006]